GEAFDKVAKLLGLGYPGGPEVSKQALSGNAAAIAFPRPYMRGTFEFSFSGLKTAVSYYLRDNKKINIPDVCASFQEAVVDTLVKKTLEAAQKYKVSNIAVGGGVAANALLRERMISAAAAKGIKARFVERRLSSDNAAMIALCAAKKLQYGKKNLKNNISIKPDMVLKSWGKAV
ncbi:MAG: tRNA (adenosine(37)-N6)-threonylcarbamoyltransferase complex transferase subunit TsaD, partial [Elusimicrobiota bacterium]|nr:tRNA (adenosine(37)-N6)-threonylcarbamoyltransferase complex transferase subunit TsaD [Elusimicrobiota bacterium]